MSFRPGSAGHRSCCGRKAFTALARQREGWERSDHPAARAMNSRHRAYCAPAPYRRCSAETCSPSVRKSTRSSTTTRRASIRRSAIGSPGIPAGPSTSHRPRHPGSMPSKASLPSLLTVVSAAVCSDPSPNSKPPSNASSLPPRWPADSSRLSPQRRAAGPDTVDAPRREIALRGAAHGPQAAPTQDLQSLGYIVVEGTL
jgi:hypothetical protein